ncbi:hypothetical protein [Actinotalea sp.]|uniref:hypothetical protein n=1 Tax=Actinotalea sp. TaxID=1872145 RepID=UPI0035662A22
MGYDAEDGQAVDARYSKLETGALLCLLPLLEEEARLANETTAEHGVRLKEAQGLADQDRWRAAVVAWTDYAYDLRTRSATVREHLIRRGLLPTPPRTAA